MRAPEWSVEGRAWPNRAHSSFVDAGNVAWHVQRSGKGTRLLLLHGTGAATHSWGQLLPILAQTHDVVALDLPGHGFSRAGSGFRYTLQGMARAIGELCDALDFAPEVIIGHSAGAAIAIQIELDGRLKPQALISLNGAVLPFEGAASFLFPTMAKAFHVNPLAARAMAWAAGDRRRVERLILQTGSRVPPAYVDGYASLLKYPAQVAGALAMMASWDLGRLSGALERIELPVVFLAGSLDRAVPPRHAVLAAQRVRHGRHEVMKGLGHLAHEEDPAGVAAQLLKAF